MPGPGSYESGDYAVVTADWSTPAVAGEAPDRSDADPREQLVAGSDAGASPCAEDRPHPDRSGGDPDGDLRCDCVDPDRGKAPQVAVEVEPSHQNPDRSRVDQRHFPFDA